MKGDNPTADEIRDMIDSLSLGRVIVAEYSNASPVELADSIEQVARILRYALRCRIAEDRIMATEHNTDVMESESEVGELCMCKQCIFLRKLADGSYKKADASESESR